MGGWMTYQRMRNRNGLMKRKPADDPDPYFRDEKTPHPGLVGDLNRMERDYTNPVYPDEGWAQRQADSDPSAEAARVTGVPIEDVRKVMHYVFFEQQ